MVRGILLLLILAAGITSTAQNTFTFTYHTDFPKILAETKASGELNYQKLLKRFNANDTTLTNYEVLALLIGFTDSKHFDPYGDDLATSRQIYKLNDEGHYKKALSKCRSFLKNHPVNQQALIECSFAYYKLGNLEMSERYAWRFRKIMEAMAATGDGRTAQTAIFSLGPTDGQNFIVKHLRSKIGSMSSGRDTNGNFIDILQRVPKSATADDDQSYNMYFQIQHAVSKMFK
jgi:hypothetical protein